MIVPGRLARRKALSATMVGLCAVAVAVALVPLAMILFYILSKGFTSLSWSFFTKLPKPVGEVGGGMANAIVGSLELIGLGSVMAVPVGVLAGVYVAEYRSTPLATAIRFCADVLNGIPSIVIGIFAYGLVVLPMRRFSAIAGGVALGIMMIPIITRTTEELINLIPGSLREAGARARGHACKSGVHGDRAGRPPGDRHRHSPRDRPDRRGDRTVALHGV